MELVYGLKSKKFFVVMPTFMDGDSVAMLVPRISLILRSEFKKCQVTFLVVDDSLGQDQALNELIAQSSKNLGKSEELILLTPTYKGGNQAAILWALHTYAWPTDEDAILIVMDSDGEDSPTDLIKLISKLIDANLDLVYAKRGTRYAPIKFKIGRFMFQCLFRILTGSPFETGNFSVMRVSWMKKCLNTGSFTSSFAGELSFMEARKEAIFCNRAPRLKGMSKTNFASLVNFGFKQLIPWSEIISVRAFFFFMSSSFLAGSTTVFTLFLKFQLNLATPTWSTLMVGLSLIIALLSFTLFVISISIVIQVDATKRLVRRVGLIS